MINAAVASAPFPLGYFHSGDSLQMGRRTGEYEINTDSRGKGSTKFKVGLQPSTILFFMSH